MKTRAHSFHSTIAALAAAGGLIHFAAAGEDAAPAALGDSGSKLREAVQDCACAASLYKVVFTGTRFCCAGQDGTIRTSGDGLEWQDRDSHTDVHLRSVSAADDKVVAVGDHGVIVLSRDAGETWEKVESGVRVDLSDVAFGGGLFVAVGSGGAILTSADGHQWDRQDCGSGSDLRSVSCGEGQWLVSGGARTLLWSEDGKNWTPVSMDGSTPCFGRTAFLGDSFAMIVGRSMVLRSFDSWSWQTELRADPAHLRAIASGAGADVAVGEAGNILVSRRRGHWKECPSPTRRALYGVGFGCDGFVAVGAGGVILFSEDGFSWESVEAR